MKTKVFIATAILVFVSVFAKSQNNEHKDHIWSYEGKRKTIPLAVM